MLRARGQEYWNSRHNQLGIVGHKAKKCFMGISRVRSVDKGIGKSHSAIVRL